MEATSTQPEGDGGKPDNLEELIHYMEEHSMEDVKLLKPKERLDFLVKAKKIKEEKTGPLSMSISPAQPAKESQPEPDDKTKLTELP